MANDKSTSKQQNNASDDEYEDVPDSYAEAWKEPKVGESISGEYCGARMVRGDRGEKFPTYVIKRDDDTLVSVAGASMAGRMARIPEGTRIKITFTGKEKSGKGSEMKLFDIKMAKNTKLLPLRMGAAQGDDSFPPE